MSTPEVFGKPQPKDRVDFQEVLTRIPMVRDINRWVLERPAQTPYRLAFIIGTVVLAFGIASSVFIECNLASARSQLDQISVVSTSQTSSPAK